MEEVIGNSVITERLAHAESFMSPFRVLVDQKGQLAVEPASVFSEGSGDIQLPALLTNPESVTLPGGIFDQGWQGEVILAVAVKTDGIVGETMVMESSGNESLDRWAQELVQGWRFRPAMKDGMPVYECFQIPVVFRTESV